MNKLIDKLLIFSFCAIFYVKHDSSIYAIITLLIAIIFSCLYDLLDYFNKSYISNKFKILNYLLYCVLCIFEIDYIYFLPLIIYDIFNSKFKFLLIITLLPILINLSNISNDLYYLIFPLISVSCLIKYRTIGLENLKKDYSNLRDTTTEYSINLNNENKNLIQKQDYEINIAILKERNRIAREIHDNVGHLLSSAILQIGAIMAKSKDSIINENLSTLKTTLSKGMDSIRCSIHNMHDEYIDLNLEIENLINDFTFCKIKLDYDIQNNIDKKYKFCFISIIKESLSNIIKHSNASEVTIILHEHPAIYQLIINDNGTKKTSINTDGIGLKNIKERVNNLEGIINITNEKGFCIFISIPKNM